MFGSDYLKTHGQTQETIAISFGESKFYGIVKAATMGIGIKSMFTDLGLEVEIQVNMDPSAARSISSRRGAGEFGTWRCASYVRRRGFAEESCLSSRFVGRTKSPTA